MPCNTTLIKNIPECVNIVKINAGLVPNTEYATIVIGDSRKEYLRLYTTDSEGSFELSTGLYPTGYFNSGSGFYHLYIVDPVTNCGNLEMTICNNLVDSLVLNVVKVDPVPETYIIG